MCLTTWYKRMLGRGGAVGSRVYPVPSPEVPGLALLGESCPQRTLAGSLELSVPSEHAHSCWFSPSGLVAWEGDGLARPSPHSPGLSPHPAPSTSCHPQPPPEVPHSPCALPAAMKLLTALASMNQGTCPVQRLYDIESVSRPKGRRESCGQLLDQRHQVRG